MINITWCKEVLHDVNYVAELKHDKRVNHVLA